MSARTDSRSTAFVSIAITAACSRSACTSAAAACSERRSSNTSRGPSGDVLPDDVAVVSRPRNAAVLTPFAPLILRVGRQFLRIEMPAERLRGRVDGWLIAQRTRPLEEVHVLGLVARDLHTIWPDDPFVLRRLEPG